jgi:hypothetical protein
LGRTASAVALKMANLASLDQTLDRRGMSNASSLDRRVWADFMNHMDRYIDAPVSDHQDGFAERTQLPIDYEDRPVGLDVPVDSTRRQGQEFFRRMIIASYDERCALSGISDARMLVACHIAPWAEARERRLDPTNGICLNPLLDKAFERGIITLADDLRVMIARETEPKTSRYIIEKCGSHLRMPSKFRPDRELVAAHRSKFTYDYIPLSDAA